MSTPGCTTESTPLLGAGTPPKVSPSQVTKDVYVLEPAKHSLAKESDPRVILIFGWMDAHLRSLLTYMTKYNAIYPGATQVLVLCRQSSTWSSKQANMDSVRPAAEILKSLGLFGSSPPNILVHVFSNGGGFRLISLSELVRQMPQHPEAASPSNCLILDSVPGGAGLTPLLRAFTAPIKQRLVKLLAYIPLTLLWLFLVGTSVLTGKPGIITDLRDGLNNPNLLPWMTLKTPRVYIYSKEDLMVPSEEVERHIAVAKTRRGLSVTAELFHDSPHVAHARADPDRYWSIVRNIWTAALGATAEA
ncbi:hypothetical protein BXZ70DRAFT_976280 [Cristinia sonorae]|uniref:Indole-diterpene biosynthesis protein PaxU n=1 Tax=Cristinia sonorae TaxID=1940300 RepID=A0A8K0UL13_9AGAR|nr:hypothetical protein BXZ70DRAFT_976280 [Cristinia sonorae]